MDGAILVRYYMFRSFCAFQRAISSYFGWYGRPWRLDELARQATEESGVQTFTMSYSVDTADKTNGWITECVRQLEEVHSMV